MKEIIINSPVDGVVKDIESVDDPVFAQKMLGEGIAIVPSNGDVVSPIDGKVIVAFPTGHAFGIASKEGFEILLHIGIDTVELNGEGFTLKTKQDNIVNAGDSLTEVNLEELTKRGVSIDTMLIFPTSSFGDWEIKSFATGDIKKGEELIRLIRK